MLHPTKAVEVVLKTSVVVVEVVLVGVTPWSCRKLQKLRGSGGGERYSGSGDGYNGFGEADLKRVLCDDSILPLSFSLLTIAETFIHTERHDIMGLWWIRILSRICSFSY